MYKLIIVDDEQIVLTGIQKVFKMSDYQFNIAGTFSNPLKALESMKDLSPDLIITDIKMPQINGLEFSIKARQILPDVEIVVLSGHDDFTFAQTAVKLGISDYLLKPVRKKDFEKMLQALYDKIKAKNKAKEELIRLRKAQKANFSTLRNKFFLTLAEQGDRNNPYVENLYSQLGFTFKDSTFILIKFVIYEMDTKDDYISDTEKIIAEFSTRIEDYGKSESFYTDEYLYFYLYDIQRDSFSRHECLSNALSYSQMKAENGLRLLTGISQIYESMSSLFYAVSDCDEYILTEDSRKSDAGNILGDLYDSNQNLHLPYTGLESIFTAISINDKSKITDSIENIFDFPDTSIFRKYIYSITVILFIRMSHLQNKYKADKNTIPLNLLDSTYLRNNYPTLDQVRTLVVQKSFVLADIITSHNTSSSSQTIVDALHYIDSNFCENISLSDVADNIFISKNYLCDIFKKELGTTFMDYVTGMRIEKAKKLLTNTNMKMYEISKEVGYKDYAYFSQIFKRYTGVTLSNFRKTN